jgi:hypothetical protein
VTREQPHGFSFTPPVGRTVSYNGDKVEVPLGQN